MRTLYLVVAAALGAAGCALAQSSTATGVSRAFNPAISVNALVLGRVADHTTAPTWNGVDLQETEVRFTSVVDPYWKADVVFAVHPSASHDDADTDGAHSAYTGHVEVAKVAGRAVPGGFGLILGRDYLPFGKHAPLHTHQFPFVDAPAAVGILLGEHSLGGTGAQLAHSLPLPWYSDLTAYAADSGAEIFAPDSRDLAWGARWSNLFELSTETTLEIGSSWLQGPIAPDYLITDPPQPLSGKLDIWGADVTYKWISAAASRGPALTVTGEVVLPRPSHGGSDTWGWYALAQYRFRRSWWLGLGTGGVDQGVAHDTTVPDADHGLYAWEKATEYKINVTWVPSEFSSVRCEVAHYDDRAGHADDTVVALQVNVTIGSHPAHLY